MIKMETLGLCGTDLSIVAGKVPVEMPRVVGHEGIGTIEVAGPSGAFDVGQRVLINPGIVLRISASCVAAGIPISVPTEVCWAESLTGCSPTTPRWTNASCSPFPIT